MKSLEDRVASLEKSNRRWRCAALLGVVVAGIAAAKPNGATTDLVRTRRLEVVDNKNNLVAEIRNGSEEIGFTEGIIRLFAAEGKPRVILLATDVAGGTLSLNSDEGYTSATPGSLTFSVPARELLRGGVGELGPERIAEIAQGYKRLELGMVENGGGFVRVLNPHGKVVAAMESDKGNAGLVTARDFNGDIKQTIVGR